LIVAAVVAAFIGYWLARSAPAPRKATPAPVVKPAEPPHAQPVAPRKRER